MSRLLTALGGDKPAEFVKPLAKPPPSLIKAAKRLNSLPIKDGIREILSLAGLQLLEYLLFIEQHQIEENIKFYNIEGAKMATDRSFLRLQVHGLAEKRPSVLIGDSVLARSPSDRRRAWRGYVHVVERESVLLKFNSAFHSNFINGSTHHIQFSVNDLPAKRCLTALKLLSTHKNVKYFRSPMALYESTTPDVPNLTDAQLLSRAPLNSRQKQAVSFIAFGPILRAPYILFGPAGTGKTTTLVEAILQVVRMDDTAKVLVVTPSNSAADHVVEKLSPHFKPLGMFRLNALHRRSETVPAAVNPYCHEQSTDWFSLPSMGALRDKSVVVATCISAGMLYAVDIGEHFTHVFVDEASQATEPETLIALAGITTQDCRFVLAGDPKQLGPIIHSVLARRMKYDMSFMERLFGNATYQKYSIFNHFGGYNPFYITKLTHNYRSHASLLQVPSTLFYDSELIASAVKQRSESFIGWRHLPNPNVPLLFHSITFKDEREENSPSYFNAGEASVVVDYVKKVLAYEKWPVRPKDIGIISPYHKQVQKIRTALTKESALC
jgi:helicase MOV-10